MRGTIGRDAWSDLASASLVLIAKADFFGIASW
jgi:hypothetical protein